MRSSAIIYLFLLVSVALCAEEFSKKELCLLGCKLFKKKWQKQVCELACNKIKADSELSRKVAKAHKKASKCGTLPPKKYKVPRWQMYIMAHRMAHKLMKEAKKYEKKTKSCKKPKKTMKKKEKRTKEVQTLSDYKRFDFEGCLNACKKVMFKYRQVCNDECWTIKRDLEKGNGHGFPRQSCAFLSNYCQKITILEVQQECYMVGDKVCSEAYKQVQQSDSALETEGINSGATNAQKKEKCQKVCAKISEKNGAMKDVRATCFKACDEYDDVKSNGTINDAGGASAQRACNFLSSYCKKIPLFQIKDECDRTAVEVCAQ